MNAKFESLTAGARPSSRAKTANRRRQLLAVEQMEERTLLSAFPLRIGSLGDSITDEYAFYAPYRPAAQNWVQILSGLRGPQASNQITFGTFSATTRGETRNSGYAQDWARSGATAVGNDVVGAMTTLVNQYNGGYMGEPVSQSPGLLNQTMSNGQPSGLTNIDVATLLIGGNDYEAEVENVLETVAAATSIPAGNANIGEYLVKSLYNAFTGTSQGSIPIDIATGVNDALTAITDQNPTFPIVVISPPNLAYAPLVQNANAALNGLDIPGVPKDTILQAFSGAASLTDGILTGLVAKFAQTDKNIRFLNLDKDVLDPRLGSPTNIQNLVIGGKNGTTINSMAAGPIVTDFSVGDGFHPGTVAQGLLAQAIVSQINSIFVTPNQPPVIAPITDSEILAYAQRVQPVTKVTLTGPSSSVPLGSPATFMVNIPSFANVADPDPNAKNFDQYPPTGSVTFIDVAQGYKVLGVASLIPQGSGGTFTGSVATFTTTTLSAGSHQVVAIYNGDTVYPSNSTASVNVYVAKGAQAQVFSVVTNLQTQLGVQIAQARVNRWNKQLSRGARAKVVARAEVKYLFSHTTLPRKQAIQLVRKALHAINAG